VTEFVDRPRAQRHEIRTLNAEEARAFLAAAAADPLEALYVVALTTGLRQGSISSPALLGDRPTARDLEEQMRDPDHIAGLIKAAVSAQLLAAYNYPNGAPQHREQPCELCRDRHDTIDTTLEGWAKCEDEGVEPWGFVPLFFRLLPDLPYSPRAQWLLEFLSQYHDIPDGSMGSGVSEIITAPKPSVS
jgi:hypothetical protein